MKNDSYVGLVTYFEKNPKRLIVVLTPEYFLIYNALRNGGLLLNNHFTGAEFTKSLRKGKFAHLALKSLYILFGRKVICAIDKKTDVKMRRKASSNSRGWWASVKPKTILRLNPKATIICAKDKHEAKKLQIFLARITKGNGTTDFSLAENLHFKIKLELRNLHDFENKIQQCMNYLRT